MDTKLDESTCQCQCQSQSRECDLFEMDYTQMCIICDKYFCLSCARKHVHLQDYNFVNCWTFVRKSSWQKK